MRAKTKSEELHQEASRTSQPEAPAGMPMSPELEERIRQRAYELSQRRDSNGGDEMSDWYQAEAEIRAALGPS